MFTVQASSLAITAKSHNALQFKKDVFGISEVGYKSVVNEYLCIIHMLIMLRVTL